MIIKPYEQWRSERVAIEIKKARAQESQHKLTCKDCGGSGKAYCLCDCPNCDGYKDCEECGGSGSLAAHSLTDAQIEESAASLDDYLSELLDELTLLSEWTRKPLLTVLEEAGLATVLINEAKVKVSLPGLVGKSITRNLPH